MKEHMIIPIFIPHLGCPNDCVFCNQRRITAREEVPDVPRVKDTIDTWLSSTETYRPDVVEVAFYGGSFTGIPFEDQHRYLSVAKEYKEAGKIDRIHLSTRPDYIDDKILDLLCNMSVDVVELGVQSFSPDVLTLSNRGHDIDSVYRACSMIKERNMDLGIQLMIGLPGDDFQRSLMSAEKARELEPSVVRLYPTVVLENTELALMLEDGRFKPFSMSQMLYTTKEMYKILDVPGISIIRVGLKSTDLINAAADLSGNFHPAFRQLVEGEIAKESLEKQLIEAMAKCEDAGCDTCKTDKTDRSHKRNFYFMSNEKFFPAMIGHKACNKKYFSEKYPDSRIAYRKDGNLENNRYRVVEY